MACQPSLWLAEGRSHWSDCRDARYDSGQVANWPERTQIRAVSTLRAARSPRLPGLTFLAYEDRLSLLNQSAIGQRPQLLASASLVAFQPMPYARVIMLPVRARMPI